MSVELKNFTLNRSVNPNAQFSVGNMVAFADAAQSSPTDGTGGSPSVTITRTTSSPLDGAASFLFTKDAANRQGEGFSADITLQSSDATKPLILRFDYQISTGTYTGYQTPPSFSDLTIWFYDVTNSAMYQFENYQLDGSVSTTNQYSYQGSVQVPVGCLTGRVIWFLGNTGASAFTAKFNNISLGRNAVVSGAAVSPWISFTPTGSWSANTTYTGFYRRVGDSLDLDIKVAVTNAPTSANLTINLPSGFTIDTAKLTDTGQAIASIDSAVTIRDAGTDVFSGAVTYNTSTSIAILKDDGDGTLSAVTQAAPMTWANGDYASIQVSNIPITGFSANAVLGQNTSSNVIAAQYTITSGVTTFTNVNVPIQFDTKTFDTTSTVTTGTSWKFTAPIFGYYNVGSVTSVVAGTAQPYIYKNGSLYTNLCLLAIGITGAAVPGSALVQMNAGDYIDIRYGSGATLTVTNEPLSNRISIHRIAGPASAQAPEIITARYSTNAGQSISNNSVTIIDYEDKSYDDHSCVTTGASWKFTCPRAGKVKVNAEATLSSNAGWALGETAYLSVFKNAVEYGRGPYDAPATATLVVDLSVNDTVDVLAGDTIDIRIFQLSGGSISLDSTSVKNYVAINYVGGIS